MNPQKSELKQAILHELGCDLDDTLEEATKRANGHTGARGALRLAAKNAQAIAEVVDAELKSGKLAERCAEDGEGPLDPVLVAKYAKLQITRVVDGLDIASQSERNREIMAQGEVAALKSVVALIQKRHTLEAAKLEAFNRAIAEGAIQLEEDGAPSGARPGPSIAAQRKAEEAASAAQDAGKSNGKPKARKGRKAATRKRKAPSKPREAKPKNGENA